MCWSISSPPIKHVECIFLGAACSTLSVSVNFDFSLIAQFPNGTAVLWWDAKHHSKSPLFCPLCVSEATVSYHLEGPHPSVPLTFLLMGFSSVLFPSHFLLLSALFLFFCSKTSFCALILSPGSSFSLSLSSYFSYLSIIVLFHLHVFYPPFVIFISLPVVFVFFFFNTSVVFLNTSTVYYARSHVHTLIFWFTLGIFSNVYTHLHRGMQSC